MSSKISDAMSALGAALIDLRTADPASALVDKTARAMRAALGPRQRAFLLWVAWASAEDADIHWVITDEIRHMFHMKSDEGD